mmetsp:Transcript_26462/g.68733  ORF Transcript_26462/g.68733 Transcript_26462/m.68733 type:complete len:204 (+) Transcript_26462:2244-2855(+)
MKASIFVFVGALPLLCTLWASTQRILSLPAFTVLFRCASISASGALAPAKCATGTSAGGGGTPVTGGASLGGGGTPPAGGLSLGATTPSSLASSYSSGAPGSSSSELTSARSSWGCSGRVGRFPGCTGWSLDVGGAALTGGGAPGGRRPFGAPFTNSSICCCLTSWRSNSSCSRGGRQPGGGWLWPSAPLGGALPGGAPGGGL